MTNSESNHANQVIKINELEFFADRNLLKIGPDNRELRPKVSQLLFYLTQNSHRTISKSELIEHLWDGNELVGDRALIQTMWQLRKLLGDSSENPTYIETVAKQGYRLIAKISRQSMAGNTNTPLSERRFKPWFVIPITLCVLVVSAYQFFFGFSPLKATVISDPKLITNYQGVEQEPRFSRDGKYIAFIKEGETGISNIFVMEAGNQTVKPRQITHSNFIERSPSWSPDGDKIAFIREGGQGECGIVVIDLEDMQERDVTRCAFNLVRQIDWSPDSNRLAYSYYDAPQKRGGIAIYDFLDDKSIQLTSLEVDIQLIDYCPRWSPDGKQILFARNLPNGIHLVTIALQGEAINSSVVGHGFILGGAWQRDGRHYIYSHYKAKSTKLYRIDTHTNTIELVDSNFSKAFYPTIDLNSQRIAYSTDKVEIGLSMYNHLVVPRPHTRGVVKSIGVDRNGSYSPDGKRVVYESTRNGKVELWIAELESGFNRPIPLSMPSPSHPSWSPSGRHIAFVNNRHASIGGNIFVYDLSTRTIKQVSADGIQSDFPTWSGDGKLIYYSKRQAGSWNIWQLDPRTGIEKQITFNGGQYAQESKDGQYVYFTKVSQNGLQAIEKSSGKQVEVLSDFDTSKYLTAWTLSVSGVYYLVDNNKFQQLNFYHFKDKANATIASFEARTIPQNNAFDFHSNNGVLFTERLSNEEDLVMGNLP